MEPLSFTHVPPEGFTAFAKELADDEWATIDIASYVGPNRTPARPLHDAPVVVVCKIQLSWCIEWLGEARQGAGNAKELDRNWDNAQKRLRTRLDLAAIDDDPHKRDAAGRLRKKLLLGAGEAQTKLTYQQETDFGRQQLEITASGQAAADIMLLDLGGAMDDIRRTTEALAAGIGHGQTSGRPFEWLREAKAGCIATFGNVANLLEWLATHGQTGADRTRAAKLRVPLEALAARYPAPTATKAPADEDGTPPDGGDAPVE